MSKLFVPPPPITPPKLDFDDLDNSVKSLHQSANWYRNYAKYLEDLSTCNNFSDCVNLTDSLDWNKFHLESGYANKVKSNIPPPLSPKTRKAPCIWDLIGRGENG